MSHFETPSERPRFRSLGINCLDGTPGPYNAITDVGNIEVGYQTLISDNGPSVRTGVTAILPHGRAGTDKPVMAGLYSLNGNGEMTGSHWIEESGFYQGPVMITNTHSVGVVRDATVKWMRENFGDRVNDWLLPAVAETYDGELNDIDGHHVTEEDAVAAIEAARGGAIEMGSVGGGTGMVTYDFKAGSASASRVVRIGTADYTVGTFVQSNFGVRKEFVIGGVPIGRELPGGEVRSTPAGSIIAIVATDAPLLSHQLKRLARRIPMGLARTGSIAHNGSGDIMLAFSTANDYPAMNGQREPVSAQYLPNDAMDPLFTAVIESTEEAVIDSMVTNQTMTGLNGVTVRGLPVDEVVDVWHRYRPQG